MSFETIFTIGITTFNREGELRKNLRSIAQVKADLIEAVYIVNQGKPLSYDVTDILPNAILIEQKNLGGAGGFTRTMVSSLAGLHCERKPTHHIIMDDDAAVESEMFQRVAQATNESPGTCFGGHMRFKEDTGVIAELGVSISKNGTWKSVGRNIRASAHEAQKLLQAPIEIDAHAWWFWIVPVSVMKVARLPLPLFIKGDDIEYSYRCRSLGYPTRYLPDIYITHPAIFKKGSDWRFYYLARNNAIFSALSDGIVLKRHYAFFRIIAALLRHEYYRAELEMKGIRDFLAGPDIFLDRHSDTIHAELMAFQKMLTKPVKRMRSNAELKTSKDLKLINYLWAACLAPFYLGSSRLQFIWDSPVPVDPMLCLGRDYETLLSGGEEVEVFRYNRGAYILGFIHMLPLAVRFFFTSRKATDKWSKAKQHLTSHEYWNKLFKS